MQQVRERSEFPLISNLIRAGSLGQNDSSLVITQTLQSVDIKRVVRKVKGLLTSLIFTKPVVCSCDSAICVGKNTLLVFLFVSKGMGDGVSMPVTTRTVHTEGQSQMRLRLWEIQLFAKKKS